MRGPARSVGRSSGVSSRWHGTSLVVSALLVLLLVPVQFAHAQLVGRYVRLILDTSYLHFSELIVWKPGDLDTNLALLKPVTSSYEGWGGTSDGLVDNDVSTYCHTNNGGWVMVDLGEEKEIGGVFLYSNWCCNNRAIGLYVEILDASQNVVLTTTSITDGRKGYMLDFTGGFMSPNDTNQWRGLVQEYAAGDALDGWQQFVVYPKCDCCEAQLKQMGLATESSNCVVE
jgi:hypothetical protein